MSNIEQKLLFTIVIPCYNGEQFLPQSLHSIVNARVYEEGLMEKFEVIVIDDGSTDNSLKVARAFAKDWNKVIRKNFIRVIKKENGQYGSVINRGLKEANGLYFKVLDVDDTFNTSSFVKILYIALGFRNPVDVIFTDHTYERVGDNVQEEQSLKQNFVPATITKMKDVTFPRDLITMHSIIYRTKLLEKINYHQLEGVYYSDSQYSLIPMMAAKTIYYVHLPLYRYYIGHDEQSISMKTMLKNRQHQYDVMIQITKEIDFSKIETKNLVKFAARTIKTMIQWQIMLIANDNRIEQKHVAVNGVINEIKKLQPKHYKMILSGPLFWLIYVFKGHFIPFVVKTGIKIYSKFKKNVSSWWD